MKTVFIPNKTTEIIYQLLLRRLPFDKVWYEGLILKLKQIFLENIFGILKSYLSDRKFVIIQGNFLSSPQKINSGVPQGSILFPVLYLVFTADMPVSENIRTSTFADNTAFLSVHMNLQIASQFLQKQV